MKRSQAIDARRQASLEETRALLQNVESQDALKLAPLAARSGRLVELEGVTVSYDGRIVCLDIGFSLLPGERIALRGRNGCGKSSLLRLLMGQAVPHSGTVVLSSGVRVSCCA